MREIRRESALPLRQQAASSLTALLYQQGSMAADPRPFPPRPNKKTPAFLAGICVGLLLGVYYIAPRLKAGPLSERLAQAGEAQAVAGRAGPPGCRLFDWVFDTCGPCERCRPPDGLAAASRLPLSAWKQVLLACSAELKIVHFQDSLTAVRWLQLRPARYCSWPLAAGRCCSAVAVPSSCWRCLASRWKLVRLHVVLQLYV